MSLQRSGNPHELPELFEWPPVRSQRARWALEELEIGYASRLVDLTKGEQDADAYRSIHPLGVVPALRTGTYTMFESVAIVMQLIDERPDRNMAPPPGSPQRALYYQWCVFACAELDPAIMTFFDNTMRPPEHMRPRGQKQDPVLAAKARSDFCERAELLSDALAGKKHLLGDGFTGADILIGHSCFMATVTGLIEDFPALRKYYAGLLRRPAYKRAYGP